MRSFYHLSAKTSTYLRVLQLSKAKNADTKKHIVTSQISRNHHTTESQFLKKNPAYLHAYLSKTAITTSKEPEPTSPCCLLYSSCLRQCVLCSSMTSCLQWELNWVSGGPTRQTKSSEEMVIVRTDELLAVQIKFTREKPLSHSRTWDGDSVDPSDELLQSIWDEFPRWILCGRCLLTAAVAT